jgi:hypothetical protein
LRYRYTVCISMIHSAATTYSGVRKSAFYH